MRRRRGQAHAVGRSVQAERERLRLARFGHPLWEFGHDRALRFAEQERKRGKIKKVAVVGAILQLGNCFDLMDTKFTDELTVAFEMLDGIHEQPGRSLPVNSGKTPDRKVRRLDCAVLNP